MILVIESLAKTAITPARRHPEAAVAISLAIHGLAAAFLFFVPLKIVQWTNAGQPAPFEVTLADESFSEDIEIDSVSEEAPAKPEFKPARPATDAISVTPLKVLANPGVEPEQRIGQLAFVTVSETFEPSLEFEEEEETPEPESKPAAPTPKPKPDPSSKPSKPAGKVSSADTQIVNARAIRNPSPVYPKSARSRGKQGTAIFSVSISSKGSVNSMWLSKSSGHSILDSAAEKALRRWQFAPASRGGIAVASQVRVPIQFRIE